MLPLPPNGPPAPDDGLSADSGFDASPGGVALERRRSHREPIVAIGHLLPAAGRPNAGTARPTPILVTDLSLHGCDFRCDTPLEMGGLYRLDVAVGALSITSRLRVVRTRRRFDGTHEVGAEFI